MKFLLIYLFILPSSTQAELFTSIAHLKSLIDVHKEIPEIIESYIKIEENRLQTLQRLIESHRNKNKQMSSDGTNSLRNPIRAFSLIKHLVSDWSVIENLMKQNVADEFLRNLAESRMKQQIKHPTDEDLSGAAAAIFRLQDVYRLSTKDLANGKIYNIDSNQTLSAKDCFLIGRAAYVAEDYYHTVLWMQEAYDKIKKENDPSHEDLQDIIEHLSFSLFKQGNVKRALLLAEELLETAPNHQRAASNIKWYENTLREEGFKPNEFRRNIPPVVNRREDDLVESNKERDIYEALCRNEVPVSIKELSKLYCYYKQDRPYLLLAPFKVEIMRFNPLAVIFRNVISDEEIDIIQEMAQPLLKRATVQNSVTGQLETASYRISKSTWLKSSDHEVVERINRRTDFMTNLEQETAEELQIANYGLGGHYDPHFDFARKEETRSFETLGTGNRIATVLFYVVLLFTFIVFIKMSEPEIGGATVFTSLRTTVLPSKNDALFWYNLIRSGEGDLRTRHAACPVLVGDKWVANKWIHEAGQEFRRPCGLRTFDQEKYVGDLGGPEPENHANISPF
ncbi:unnamed protein product [Dracunculus medinensis]|uniref:procollagen-proline 4-dioxygenase n=1 Tax=Dracunculus medinensis TaxID=318479 RepID=A0A158Q2N6_DRAME|nr:unnamed protein product [Dracunculus medinensis]